MSLGSPVVLWFDIIELLFVCFFFFKQKTAYEMRISDWSSDVCSSDLPRARDAARGVEQAFARRIVARPLDQRAHRVGDMIGHDHLAVWSQFTLVVAHRPAFTVAIMSHISACQSG